MSRQINIRQRLPRDLLWMMAALMAGFMAHGIVTGESSVGIDSHAYWDAWRRTAIYTTGPRTRNAYLYSPVFAQILWPLALLPWPMFGALVSVADALVLGWLLKPLRWDVAAPLWIFGLPEIVQGNISTMLAAATVLGFARPAAWALSALTKITPTMGPVWFLVRREWRSLGMAVLGIVVVATPSLVLTPDLWLDWLRLLWSNVHESAAATGFTFLGPLVLRIPLGIALLVWGARRNRRWTVPVAMFLCNPVMWLGSLTLLAAIPRIQRNSADWRAPKCAERSTKASVTAL